MSVEIAQWIWGAVAAYLVIGALFALYFCSSGVERIDRAASGAGFLFRVFIFPGAAALWPILVLQLAGSGRSRRS